MWLLSHSRITNERKDCTNCYNLLFTSLSIPVCHVLSEQKRDIFAPRSSHGCYKQHIPWRWSLVLSSKGQPIKANTPNHKHPFTTLICFCWAHALPVLAFSKYCSSWMAMAKYLWKANFISWDVYLLETIGALSWWRCWSLLSSAGTYIVPEGKVFWPRSLRVILEPAVKSTTFDGRCFVG